MEPRRQSSTTTKGKAKLGPLLVAATALLAIFAGAQDFRTHRGGAQRTGKATVQTGTVVAETVWNNAGRGFLRWWDPIFSLGGVVDNDAPNTVESPPLSWVNPAPIAAGNDFIDLATGYYQTDVLHAPYRWATTVAQPLNSTDARTGATTTYRWTITGLIPGAEYAVSASVPVGGTNTVPTTPVSGANPLHYGQRYYVFDIVDANGTDVRIVDSTVGGSFVRFGEAETKLYTADALGQIAVRLYNTVPRGTDGQFLDPGANPVNQLVYADAVRAEASGSLTGGYVASPVVGELLNAPYIGGPTVFPQRVVSARNEPVTVGSLGQTFTVGEVTSFTHNGEVVDAFAPLRRNMVWSWPGRRPNDVSTAEKERFATELADWIVGPSTADTRAQVRRVVDDLNPLTSASGNFIQGIDLSYSPLGSTYQTSPVSASVTGGVRFKADEFADGTYYIDVYVPPGAPAVDLATNVEVQVFRGGVQIDSVTINESTQRGWIRLPGVGTQGAEHSAAMPLSVVVTDHSSVAQDVIEGRRVVADAVRFVTQSDLSMSSTPAMVSADVRDGATLATRDVVVTADETGHIRCMDAHGDPTTGSQPKVFWTYPSEVSATDPNASLSEDGRVATMPTKFNLSSALVMKVGAVDLLYIGADNGRVYCIEMAGRGDGTTRRRWTYPDDFRPDAPTTPFAAALPPVKASVAGAVVAGQDAVIVAVAGKILALNAAGNPVSKTTNVIWQYPAAISNFGQVEATPAIAFGKVFFGAATMADPTLGEINALDLDTGVLSWRRTVDNTATALGYMGSCSPAAVSGSLVNPADPGNWDSVFFVDGRGVLLSLDPVNGNVRWQTSEVSTRCDSSLVFTHMRQPNPATPILLEDAQPTIVVANRRGECLGFLADGRTYSDGSHRNWVLTMQGSNPVASFASGGWPNQPGFPANRSHLYIGDSKGFLYAFSSVDDDNSTAPITPGQSPITDGPNNGVTAQDLSFISSTNVVLVSPDEYQSLFSKANQGSLTYAAVQTAATGGGIQRRNFEVGETLYVMVWNIPSTTDSPTAGYQLEFNTYSNQRVQARFPDIVRNVTGAPANQGGIGLHKVTFMPTGQAGTQPGGNFVRVRATLTVQGTVRGAEAGLRTTPKSPSPTVGDVVVANPLAVVFPTRDAVNGFLPNSVGNTIDATQPNAVVNGSNGLDTGVGLATVGGPTNQFLKPVFGGTDSIEPGGFLGTTPSTTGEYVSHGSTAVARMNVRDRSLVSLLTGPGTGLANVQMSSNDLAWMPLVDTRTLPPDAAAPGQPVYDPATQLGVDRPLNSGSNKANWKYGQFEDYPWALPNRSLDYPDLGRGSMSVAVGGSGSVSNPLLTRVTLEGPAWTEADRTTYNTKAGYENQMQRTLVDTPFDIRVDVPRYQPANASDYRGRQIVYVGGSNNSFGTEDAYRSFALGARVGEDRRLSTNSPTVDLGSLPSGGGYNGHVSGGPDNGAIAPSDPNSAFRPYNPAYTTGNTAMFQPFTVLNQGNVNLLNVRLAQEFDKINGFTRVYRTVELYGPQMQELAWIDAKRNMISDLDPLYSVPFRAGVDNRMVLQKPRPGDAAPTRMSRNPVFRANANLRVSGGTLVPTTAGFESGDPKVGVAVPVGTPSGTYQRKVYAFDNDGNDGDADHPSLGPSASDPAVSEPYADPAITLKFNVREARLTNTPTRKAAPNVDNLLAGNEAFTWSNTQPTAVRHGSGQLAVAWASNRRSNATGLPDWLTPGRTAGSLASGDTWRIFVSANGGTTPVWDRTNPSADHSPMNDLDNALPVSSGLGTPDSRWFGPSLLFPLEGVVNFNTLFTLGAGESMDMSRGPAGFQFGSPSFPTGGAYNPLQSPTLSRADVNQQYLAFVGRGTKVGPGGDRSTVEQVMLANLGFGGGGVVLNGLSAMPFDTTSTKSKPSVVQAGSSATVFYTGTSNGLGQIYTSTFDGSNWTGVRSVSLGDQFENVGAPNAILRRYQGRNDAARIDLMFTAKLRGRQFADTFLGRLAASPVSGAPTGGPGGSVRTLPFSNRTDKLEVDPATGTYFAPGVQWSMSEAGLAGIRLKYLSVDGSGNATLTDVIDPISPERVVSRTDGELVYDSRLGGKVYMDANAGTVKLSGAVVPRNMQLFITYSPTFVRVNAARGGNYRSVSGVFDERFVGIYATNDVNRADENLIGDLNFWGNSVNARPANNDPVRYDRYVLSLTKTSADGSQATRPFLTTLRYGINLPTPVAVGANGALVQFQVMFIGATPEAPFYQVDPVNGRVYFTSVMEDRPVRVVYTGVDGNGNLVPNIVVGTSATNIPRVGLITERAEEAVTIEQAANESDMSLALDPYNIAFNPLDPTRRRPPLVWMFWSSARAGVPDVYFQTIAPKWAPQPPSP
ncbi:MAG: PQQ-binding-like beta-propeller repeat protein [Fimbriimonadaceae bacterium]|nr:PQQ-binding-like beta-propeller repeat protein [Fimbriimonadaceae bacterium]